MSMFKKINKIYWKGKIKLDNIVWKLKSAWKEK